MLLSKRWKLPLLEVGTLTADLRSGGLGNAAAVKLSVDDRDVLPPGLEPVKRPVGEK